MPEMPLVVVKLLRNLKGKHLEIHLLGELFYYKNLVAPVCWRGGGGGGQTHLVKQTSSPIMEPVWFLF